MQSVSSTNCGTDILSSNMILKSFRDIENNINGMNTKNYANSIKI